MELPQPSHYWESRLYDRGTGTFRQPTESELNERLAELLKAIEQWPLHKSAGRWLREIARRKHQLETLQGE